MGVDTTTSWDTDSAGALTSPGSPVTAGDGGGVMDIWAANRATKLRELGSAAFTNKSQFGVPNGIATTTSWDTDWEAGEAHLGLGFAGQTLSPGNLPLQSTVSATDENGNNLGGSPGAGQYIVSVEPEAYAGGVLLGDNVSDPLPESVDIVVEPVEDAIPETRTNVVWPRPGFVDVVYGGITGQVVDVTGAPMEDVTVSAKNQAAATDNNGEYVLYAPGGMSLNVTALAGTTEDSVTTQKTELVEASFTAGGIKVSVVGPGGVPIQGVPVEVRGSEYRTGSDGSALVPDLPLKTFEITIMGSETVSLSVNSEGQIVSHTVESGSVLTIFVKDARTGEMIDNLPGVDLQTGAMGFSTPAGKLQLGSLTDGEYDVLVGVDDFRYNRAGVKESVPDGEIKEVSVEVEPAITTTNT